MKIFVSFFIPKIIFFLGYCKKTDFCFDLHKHLNIKNVIFFGTRFYSAKYDIFLNVTFFHLLKTINHWIQFN
ncbi:hypothetical protein BpHYR1_011456 [Brachionus plicatilis]|uniref:Uncharacterized protein n=1 Tax=Brachionus plicatilis TaxID=10195 RepID=A0A3M7QFQ5_BRAPC|nr:hypothetical protein BpHYR1_011456 [Brachionus plicatilis]